MERCDVNIFIAEGRSIISEDCKSQTATRVFTKQKKLELGELAYQYGLHQFETQRLSAEFEKIAQTFGGINVR